MTKHTRYWPMGCTNVVVRLGMLTVIVLPSICAGNAVVGSGQIAAQGKEAKNTIVSSRDKIKEAGQACFAALKNKKQNTKQEKKKKTNKKNHTQKKIDRYSDGV